MTPTSDPNATALRSHLGGALRRSHAGTAVRLGGWVHKSRDLGGLVFIDLRDRDGLVQVSFNPDWTAPEVIAAAAAVGTESAVLVEGIVEPRPDGLRNADLPTGEIEVRATSIRVVGPAETAPIPVALGKDAKLASEELRLRHRVHDLRRAELQHALVLRHRLLQTTRRFLSERGYLELETPILTKPTPEGARDFLVPSRMHAGEFFALPQSPQIYKQLFMCAGFDRYFQLARCFRDEDLRADRQLEFTQIDIEASFVEREDILAMSEGLIAALWAEAGVTIQTPFRRLTKDRIVRMGSSLPLHLTFSCINPKRGLHCGDCCKCKERIDAFLAAGVPDRTSYAGGPGALAAGSAAGPGLAAPRARPRTTRHAPKKATRVR